jgi:hypothetical protein
LPIGSFEKSHLPPDLIGIAWYPPFCIAIKYTLVTSKHGAVKFEIQRQLNATFDSLLKRKTVSVIAHTDKDSGDFLCIFGDMAV